VKPKKPAFEALLFLDNAPGHMQNLGLSHLTTQVENLSSTLTSMLQLLGQGIVTAFERTLGHTSCIILDAGVNGTFVRISGC